MAVATSTSSTSTTGNCLHCHRFLRRPPPPPPLLSSLKPLSTTTITKPPLFSYHRHHHNTHRTTATTLFSSINNFLPLRSLSLSPPQTARAYSISIEEDDEGEEEEKGADFDGKLGDEFDGFDSEGVGSNGSELELEDSVGIDDGSESDVEEVEEGSVKGRESVKIPNLTVKEKKELASYAHGLGKKLKSQSVGKSGVTDSVASSFVENLERNELLKIKIHRTCPGELEEVVHRLEEATGSVVVGQIGRTVIVYRPSLSKLKAEEKKNESRRVFVRKRAKPRPAKPSNGVGQLPRPNGRGRRGISRISTS